VCGLYSSPNRVVKREFETERQRESLRERETDRQTDRHAKLHRGIEEITYPVCTQIEAHKHLHVTSARKEVTTKLVKAHTHHSIGEVEGILNTITVMHIDVDVENSRVMSFKSRPKEESA
jgi:hypothetical protein